LVGVATVVKINLVIGAGFAALLVGLGTTKGSVLTIPALAAVCGVAAAGVLLVGLAQE